MMNVVEHCYVWPTVTHLDAIDSCAAAAAAATLLLATDENNSTTRLCSRRRRQHNITQYNNDTYFKLRLGLKHLEYA